MARRKSRWRQITTIQSFKSAKRVRVFGIARVSTDKQAKKIGESLDHQREVLSNWVRSKSSLNAPQVWELVQVFVENEEQNGTRKGRTATRREGRKGLVKALELAKLNMIDVVVVTKLDRIARNVKDYIGISAEFNESGVAMVCLDLDIDTSTPDGQMIMRNHANLAQWQADRIAQYSYETIERHISQGRPLGPPPIGYIKSDKDEYGKSIFLIDPAYRKHVEFIDKTYMREKSLIRVLDALHKKGYKSRRGKTYTIPQVSRILQNIRYTGRQSYEGKTYEGKWPPLRSLETQEIIEKIFKQNRLTNHSANPSNTRYVYLAKSILKCGSCGSGMVARPAIGSGGRYYPYYMCMKAYKTHGIDCEPIYLAAEAVDNALIDILCHLCLDPKVIEQIIKKANSASSSTIGTLESDLQRVQASLKDVRTKTANLVEVLADGGMAKLDAVKNKITVLNQEGEELALEEKRLKQELEAERVQTGSAHEYIKTLQLFNDFYRMNQDNRERIQTVIPRLINSVICYITDKKKGIGRLKIGLFGRPFAGSEHAEIWNETLQKIADECYNHKALQSVEGKFGARLHHKRIDKSGRVSHAGTGYLEPVHADKRFYVSPVSYSSQGSTAPTLNFYHRLQKDRLNSKMHPKKEALCKTRFKLLSTTWITARALRQ